MISKEEKSKIVQEFGKNQQDSGASAVQVGLLTKRINGLASHFATHKHDSDSNRGLMKMIGQRKALLKYMAGENPTEYAQVIKKLNLRK